MNEDDKNLWKRALDNEDVYGMAKQLFGIELYEGQQDVVRDIAFDKEDRISLLTPSQYGKTWSVAAAIGLYILLHEDKNILVISGTQNQARIMRDKFAEFLAECEPLADLVDTNAEGVERLKKEASKKRITFQNGCELRTLTAGGNNDAESLMGFGGDLVILDESNLISDEIYEKRVLRMLGSSADSTLLQIGNPTRRNHFYEVCKKKDNYKNIHVDDTQAVEEGSFTQSYVDEMRDEMSEREFRINIQAKFPEEDADDTLFKWSWIDEARERSFDWTTEEADRVLYGLDAARAGDDRSVLMRVEMKNGRYKVRDDDIWAWDTSDTMELARNSRKVMENRDEDRVNVDAHGIGAGVLDRLREDGMYAVGIKVGSSPNDRDRFISKKSEFYWKLRETFEEGDIDIPNHSTLVQELDDMDRKYNTRDKIKIVDPSKSPDFADALMLAISFDRPRSNSSVGSARSMF